jgi:hypothetical protein
MKKCIPILTILCACLLQARTWSMDLEKTDRIRKVIEFSGSAASRTLFIDNIFGSIRIIGGEGDRIILKADRTIKARSKQKIERALQEVTLDISQKDNEINLFVNGPFRAKDKYMNWNWNKTGYTVQYDFVLEIPKKTNIFLKTINNGDIDIAHVNGRFVVENVNGKIGVRHMNGSGRAHTVNGSVRVQFDTNPKKDCSFRTVNGNVELFFPQEPAADFLVKTFNGDILTAYSVRMLPRAAAKPERSNGRFIYKSNRFSSFRIGKGGIQIKMSTLNGDIIINKK